MKVKGFFKDIGGADRVTAVREEMFEQASDRLQRSDAIYDVAHELHPGKMKFQVVDVHEVSSTAKKYRFVAVDGVLPPFQAGQYVSLDLVIGKTITTRPYSICSAPYQARQAGYTLENAAGNSDHTNSDLTNSDHSNLDHSNLDHTDQPFFEITVRNGKSDGFAANYIYENVKVGDQFTGSLPYGEFYYEELRDSSHVVALAGGSGITPFYSMAQEIAHGTLDIDLTILYGSVSANDIILKNEIDAIHCDRVHFVNVISGDENYPGEKGFLTRDIIRKYSAEDATYFVCGPLPMYNFVRKELAALKVPQRRIRMEVFGAPKNIVNADGYPKEQIDQEYTIKVCRGIHTDMIPAKAKESVAVALERAGIPIETKCRSGACGFCRSKLLSGNIYVPADGDGRRAADKEFQYFHACSSYPLSDLTIKIPIE